MLHRTLPPHFLAAANSLQAPGGEPLSYPEARALLRRQPSLSWAAYVAGALVVLAQTQGTRFEDGLSILVSSGECMAHGAPPMPSPRYMWQTSRSGSRGGAVAARSQPPFPPLLTHQRRPVHALFSPPPDVPEGKGVSSSAAVEVASMAAVAAAYGLQLEGRTLALLCQQVENHVVGACWLFTFILSPAAAAWWRAKCMHDPCLC